MLIETLGLRKIYGTTVAVDGLSLRVNAGEVFGFLGPNGAGKTTTVKMLLGLVRPTGGAAHVLAKQPGDPAALRRIGFLPEHFRFPPWLSAADFLDMHGRLYGMPAAQRRQRIPELLTRVGLADRARSKLGEFSKGMQQRVGLAQALLNHPSLVFLDEPTSGLDPVGRREVRDIIRELRAAGVAVFLNSHLLSEVEITCDRVAIVKRGRVVRMGTLEELTRGETEAEVRVSGLTEALVAGLARWASVLRPDDGGSHNASDYPARRSEQNAVPAAHIQRLALSIQSEAALPEIAEYLVQGGARLYAIAPRRLPLEELFMRVMREEAPPQEPAP